MGDMFRSEAMALCQMFIQPEAAYTSVSELGEIGCVQFRDLNSEVSSFQRKFVSEVLRCDELERKIRYIEMELKKDDIVLPDFTNDIPSAPNPRQIIDLEAHLEKAENEILELSHNEVNLKLNYLELTELSNVLENSNCFFSDQEVLNFDSSKRTNATDDPQAPDQKRGGLAFVAGVINRERIFAFERMLWRISRGNVFLKRSDLDEPLKDPTTGYSMYKTVFVAFFQGEQLKNHIMKVCTGFHASIYPFPSLHTEREDMLKGVRTRLEDLKLVLSQTEDHRCRVLKCVSKNLPIWSIMVRKTKAIYHTLNLFNLDVTKKCLIGEGWVPIKDLPLVQKALANGSAAACSTISSFLNVIHTNRAAPTYNRMNKLTRGFQNLIDAYGIASYREINPALYTIITFPFLFAVMFGDLGHGLILLLFGAWMVIFEKNLMKKRGGEIWNIFFGGRYIILLMGLFSMYTGLIYNDVFSKSMNIFGPTWRIRYNTSTVWENPTLQLKPDVASDGVYPLGMDPIWQIADNKIIFLNTYKMKMSIIIGVIHMIFGVCMSVVNFVHFRKKANIILEFVPQILFLVLLFGYMVFMMFFKWVKYSPKATYLPDTPGCAPSVLIMFINMMLFKHSEVQKGCKEYMFDAQPMVETLLVVVALICIPWMLFAKPLYIKYKRGNVSQRVCKETPVSNSMADHVDADDDENEPLSEIYIHQAIHTIEYVLSTISHTASYLRLWALSLAHAQLSEVLWNMVLSTLGLKMFPGYAGAVMLFIIFNVWTVFTLAILVMMEGLSAFLHTLRLHWVEFMSKFYEGLGYAFQPFSFKTILEGGDEAN